MSQLSNRPSARDRFGLNRVTMTEVSQSHGH